MVDPDKPWCAPFARSEPNFSVKVTLVMMFALEMIPNRYIYVLKT